jgi:hypothetical protein
MKPLIYADFQNADPTGRVRLNTVGTLEDLAARRVTLSEGLELTLYTDDGDAADGLRLDGMVAYNKDEGCWVAAVDWAAVRPAAAKSPKPTAAGQR